MCTTRSSEFAIAVIAALSFAVGCSSSGRIGESEKAVEGFQSTKAALVKAQAQVDTTLAAMNQLSATAGGDLQKTFKNYTAAVEDLEDTAAGAKKRAEAMRKNVDAYVAKWQKEMQTMQDPTIKASLEKRRQAVTANFAKVRESAQAVREAYQPFIAQSKEIQRALSVDLSPAALPGLKPSMDKANAQGKTLKEKIAALQGELDRIAAGISPTGPSAT